MSLEAWRMICWIVGALAGITTIVCTLGVNLIGTRIAERDRTASPASQIANQPSFRPHIVISDLGLFDLAGNQVRQIQPNTTYNAVFTIRNGGQAVARNLICRSNWFRSDGPFPQNPSYATDSDWVQRASRVQLPPADTVHHPSILQPQPTIIHQLINEGRVKLWMHGELLYSDTEENNYRTVFCLRYTPQSGEWVFESVYNDAT